MRLFVVLFGLTVLTGLVTGGRLRNLPAAGVRWSALVLPALGMQLAPAGSWSMALLYGSFAVLLAFAVRNAHLPGFAAILLGLLLNLTVITANRGMPVSAAAIVRSGQQASLADLGADRDGAKHRLAGPATRLAPLGDVVAIPPPIRQIISAGDVAVYGGGCWFVVTAMRRRPRAAVAAADRPA